MDNKIQKIDIKQAIQILIDVTGQYRGTREEHEIIKAAIELIKEKSLENDRRIEPQKS